MIAVFTGMMSLISQHIQTIIMLAEVMDIIIQHIRRLPTWDNSFNYYYGRQAGKIQPMWQQPTVQTAALSLSSSAVQKQQQFIGASIYTGCFESTQAESSAKPGSRLKSPTMYSDHSSLGRTFPPFDFPFKYQESLPAFLSV